MRDLPGRLRRAMQPPPTTPATAADLDAALAEAGALGLPAEDLERMLAEVQRTLPPWRVRRS